MFVLLRAPSISRNISRSIPPGDNYIKVNSTGVFIFSGNICWSRDWPVLAVVFTITELERRRRFSCDVEALGGRAVSTDVKKI